MDLSEFDRTIKSLSNKVRYKDDSTGEDKTANEAEITWKHKYLPVSELKFYLRENHEFWEDKIADREQEVLEIWMKELKYNSLHYSVVDKKIVAKGQVETQDQIDEWLKPNPGGKLKPITPETI